MSKLHLIERIISGGQTGADTGALFAANRAGVPTGGTAARGWETEAGTAPWLADFGLTQCPEPGYTARTAANVRNAAGTIWLGFPDSPGARLTFKCAETYQKPLLHVLNQTTPRQIAEWIVQLADAAGGPIVLNVAGNRASSCNGIQRLTEAVLDAVFRILTEME